MLKKRFLFSLKGFVLLTLMLFLSACAHKSDSDSDVKKNKKISSAACAGNAYMQKYGCSLERIQSAAKSGDPDAQYALGYMYYYGIGTVRDMETSRLWIRRAAIQGQPLAKKALALMSTGGGLDSLHGGHRRHHTGAGTRVYSSTDNSGYDATGATRRRQARKKRSSSSTSVYDAVPNVHQLNTANPNAPLSDHLPNYGKKKTNSGSSNSVVNSSDQPNDTSDNTPIEPLTQLPMDEQSSDPRLAENAKPITDKASMAAQRNLPSPSNSMLEMNSRPSSSPTEQALLRIPSDQFTVQLMGGRSMTAMREFVREHHLGEMAKIYHSSYRNKTWYMLVYGEFTNVMQAHYAVQKMPPSLRSLHPWVKSFKIVHREIKSGKVQ